MMLEGYIAKDQSGIFCFFFSQPTFFDGIWMVEGEPNIAMMPEEVPEELQKMTYHDAPVKYTLFTAVKSSRPHEKD